MIPHTDSALRMLSQRLMNQLLPDLKSLYSLSDGALIGLLMNAIADEISEGIQRRLDDLAEMTVIFREAASLLSAAEVEVVTADLKSYRLADVNHQHDAFTRVLISLHAKTEVEGRDELNRSIWAYLRRHALRHQITAVP